MSSFAELRKKAEAAASGARSALPSKPTKYEPVRPGYGAPTAFPSAKERASQSTVLQLDKSRFTAPPPPRRFDSTGSSEAQPHSPLAPGRGPPPAPARKPATLASSSSSPAPPPRGVNAAPPPPLPTRKPSSPAPPYAPALPTRTASTSSYSAPAAPPPPPPAPEPLLPPRRQHPPPQPEPEPEPAVVPNLSSFPRRAPLPGNLGKERFLFQEEEVVEEKGWKKFSEYDEQDKQELFAALDTFFDSKLPPSASSSSSLTSAPTPPPVAHSTRPSLLPSSSSFATAPTPKPHELHAPSYPPPQTQSSSALSLLHWLHSTPFTFPWFVHSPSSSPLPPTLVGRSDLKFTCGWSQYGSQKEHTGCALFGDASIAWYRLSWDASSEAAGTAHETVLREARYRPAPGPLDGETLYEASELYGPKIVSWAERVRDAGVPVARGECWDLANEALKHCEEVDPSSPPFPSIGRTHGSLLYYANAGRKDEQGRVVGTWTGGDVYVRPGDVVEWRKVMIAEVGARAGGWSKLGDPDHTALILSASPPSSPPSLYPNLVDSSYLLTSLVSLTVLEQSLGSAPKVASYDLSKMSEGEVWIYRPVGMKTLVGAEEVSAEWPPRVECWEAGELE